MKGHCEMCAYDHHGKCIIDETTWVWYHKKIIRKFLDEELNRLNPFRAERWAIEDYLKEKKKQLEGEG